MGKYVLTNCKIYVDNYDISGDSNAVNIEMSTPALDATTFSEVPAKVNIPGLDEVKATISVLYDASTAYIPDDEIDTWRGGMTAKLITICPTSGASGEVGYCFTGLGATYSQGGSVGEVKKGTWNIEGTGMVYRTQVFRNVLAGITGGGSGTAFNLGLLGTGQTLYSFVHVYYINGGTLYVNIWSDDNEAFTSHTARVAGSAITTTCTETKTLAGPIADDMWWRTESAYSGGTLAKYVHSVVII